jgi:sulfide:quinone oxidoreductase
VLIAGGGVAGLEALMALRGLAEERLALTLIAPEDEFVYRPVSVEEPFAVGRRRGVQLGQAAQHADADFLSATVGEIDPAERRLELSTGEGLGYDALVLAVGAAALPAVEHAMTWDDRSDSEMLGGLLRDIEQGYAQRVAVVIPAGPGWPLRGYELALLIALRGYDMSVGLETTLVRPEPQPLALLGERAVKVIAGELERAGVAVADADGVLIETGHDETLVLEPSGRRLEVNRVLAMPILRGRPIAGLPVDADGLIAVDQHCRVAGLDRVWAAGDCTAFPLKSGGFSAAQADVVAKDIAAIAGAAVEPEAFDPDLGEGLAGLPAGRFLEEWLAEDEPGLAMHLPSSGVPLLTYLSQDLAAGWRG